MFVCFEGIDGAGKTTQAKLLTGRLLGENIPAEQVFDPGTTRVGLSIRKILLEKDDYMSPAAQMLLFSAARAELAEHIRRQVTKGVVIICDRWLLSTLVYQGEINGIDSDLIFNIFRGTSNVIPDLCFLLDLDPKHSLERIGTPRDRYERRSLEDRRRMRAAYTKYASHPLVSKQPPHFIDARQSIETTHEAIYEHFQALRNATTSVALT